MKNEKSNHKNGKDENLPGYKHYPANEDIYSRDKEETDIDPEDITKKKPENEKDPDAKNEKDFKESVSGDDLDIPGNDEDEAALGDGREDEENNYYSLGGDNRENLDENYGK